MKRTVQLFTLVAALFTLLSAAHPVAAQSPANPCAAETVSPDCVRFRAYLQRQAQTWQHAAIPESSMGATVRRYTPNWDDNDVAYIPESTMPAIVRRYTPNWDAFADIAYIPESTMVVPLAELFGGETAQVETD